MGEHFVQLESRNRLTVTEITAVDAFDEETILADLREDSLVISGKNLHIEILDLEEGRLVACGEIESFVYTKKKKSGGGFWSRFARKRS